MVGECSQCHKIFNLSCVGYSDPYVKVTLNGTQHRETKVIWKTLNPKWNETFCFSISSWDQPNTMLLKVRDKDHIFDDQLG
jgi:Ca2+-dependent lipid-binding protein